MVSKNKERINITLEKDLIKWIDDTVAAMKPVVKGINRSRVVGMLIYGFIESLKIKKENEKENERK